MTIQIIKTVIEAGQTSYLASINGEAPELYSGQVLYTIMAQAGNGENDSKQAQSNQSEFKSLQRDITQFVNYADC